ncbi:hypothetical protein D3C77_545970 [compost metagenome]
MLTEHQRGYGRRAGKSVVEPLVAVPFDGKAYARVIRRIVRGLYWQQTGEILRRDAKIQVIPSSSINDELVHPIRLLLSSSERVELNNATFVYKHLLDEDGSSFWGFQFFDKHFVFAIVSLPPEPSAGPEQPGSQA